MGQKPVSRRRRRLSAQTVWLPVGRGALSGNGGDRPRDRWLTILKPGPSADRPQRAAKPRLLRQPATRSPPEMPQARSAFRPTGLVIAHSTDFRGAEPQFSRSAETTWPEPERLQPEEPEPERLRQPGPERQHQPERSSSERPAACRQPERKQPEHSRSERQPERRQPERSRSERQPERSSWRRPEHSSSGPRCSNDRDGPSCNEPSCNEPASRSRRSWERSSSEPAPHSHNHDQRTGQPEPERQQTEPTQPHKRQPDRTDDSS
jgi:hypothetical protein